jgi:hypothetical protein
MRAPLTEDRCWMRVAHPGENSAARERHGRKEKDQKTGQPKAIVEG